MAKKKTFEEALTKLEEITQMLEDSELSLEESLQKFDDGVKLAGFCNSKLDEAQKKVDILLKKNGKLTSVPFSESENQAIEE